MPDNARAVNASARGEKKPQRCLLGTLLEQPSYICHAVGHVSLRSRFCGERNRTEKTHLRGESPSPNAVAAAAAVLGSSPSCPLPAVYTRMMCLESVVIAGNGNPPSSSSRHRPSGTSSLGPVADSRVSKHQGGGVAAEGARV